MRCTFRRRKYGAEPSSTSRMGEGVLGPGRGIRDVPRSYGIEFTIGLTRIAAHIISGFGDPTGGVPPSCAAPKSKATMVESPCIQDGDPRSPEQKGRRPKHAISKNRLLDIPTMCPSKDYRVERGGGRVVTAVPNDKTRTSPKKAISINPSRRISPSRRGTPLHRSRIITKRGAGFRTIAGRTG